MRVQPWASFFALQPIECPRNARLVVSQVVQSRRRTWEMSPKRHSLAYNLFKIDWHYILLLIESCDKVLWFVWVSSIGADLQPTISTIKDFIWKSHYPESPYIFLVDFSYQEIRRNTKKIATHSMRQWDNFIINPNDHSLRSLSCSLGLAPPCKKLRDRTLPQRTIGANLREWKRGFTIKFHFRWATQYAQEINTMAL